MMFLKLGSCSHCRIHEKQEQKMNEINKRWEKQARWLTQSLILSGALNIGLLLTFFYFIIKDKSTSTVIDHKPVQQIEPLADQRSNSVLLREMRTMTFQQLVAKLGNKQLVEDGYAQRDLALACLVSFYHFNLEKALSGMPLQQRQLIFEKKRGAPAAGVTIYPGLADVHFQTLIHFASTERWPLTSKGLFLQIKHTRGHIEPSLMETFFLTREFLEIETLFNHSKRPVDKYVILAMLREGDWQVLSDFASSQLAAQDLSEARYQRLLLNYIDCRSKIAARLMLLAHGEFAVKKLDDKHAIAILQLLSEKTPESERFAQELLMSPRGDAVLKLAAARLYQFANEPLPETYDYVAALTKFIPEQILREKISIPNGFDRQLVSEYALSSGEHRASLPPPPLRQESQSVKSLPSLPIDQIPKGPKQSLNKKKEIDANSLAQRPVKKSKERFHIVGEGETLWLISKRYSVDVEVIKAYNGLESNSLYLGLVLRIP